LMDVPSAYPEDSRSSVAEGLQQVQAFHSIFNRWAMKLFRNMSLLIFIIVFPLPLNADDYIIATKKLAGEFLKLTQNNQFEQAAHLFHYPEINSQIKNESELRSVRDGLKKYKDKFGDIIEILNNIPEADYMGFGVSGAELDYWKQHTGGSPSIILPCKFEKVNFGIISITFCKIRDKYEIQSVDFSFIKSSASNE
jgi:hypothetical protein